MKRILCKLIGTTAIIFMLCLTGLVMSGEAQAQRFTDNGNGTVTDTVTGLMWTKNANMLGKMDWNSATSRCASLAVGSVTGWRLPTYKEFPVMYNATRGEHPFEGIQGEYYWTSTEYTGYRVEARYAMHMSEGLIGGSHHVTSNYYVWCVRNAN